jgi:hypothetical protein
MAAALARAPPDRAQLDIKPGFFSRLVNAWSALTDQIVTMPRDRRFSYMFFEPAAE